MSDQDVPNPDVPELDDGAAHAAVGVIDHGSGPQEHDGYVHEHEAGEEGEEGEEEEKDEEEEEESLALRKAVKKRLIQLHGMDPGMKLLIGVGLAQLLVAALLLAMRNVSLPSIIGDQTSDTDVSDIPDIAFALAMFGFAAAWSLLLAGAYRGGWLIRLLFIGAFGWGFWEVRDVITGEGVWPPVICGGLLVIAVVLGVVTYFPEKKFRDAGGKSGEPVSKQLHRLRLATPIALFVCIGGTCLVAFLYALHFDHHAGVNVTDFGSAVTGFTTSFSYLLSNHQYVLIPILVLAGSEFGEWGDFVSRWAARRIQRPPRGWLLPVVAVLAAAAMLWDGLRTAADPDVGGGVQAELTVGAVLVAIVVLVMLAAKPRGAWSPKVPFAAVAFVAFADTVAGFIAVDRLHADDPLIDVKIYATSAMLWMALGAVSFVVLLAMRGKLNATWLNGLIFVTLVGATEGVQALPFIGSLGFSAHAADTANNSLVISNGTYFGTEGIRSIFAILTIALVIAAIVTRKLEAWRTPIAISLVLLGALQILTWIDDLFGRTTDATGSTAIIAGVVLVIAISWEFLSSGEAVTNHHDNRFARSTRIYVYLGYVLLVAISVLYYSDLHVHGTHNLIESEFDSEEWVREGILFLGVPLVVAIASARLQRWRAHFHSAEAPAVEELAPVEGDGVPAAGGAVPPVGLEPLG